MMKEQLSREQWIQFIHDLPDMTEGENIKSALLRFLRQHLHADVSKDSLIPLSTFEMGASESFFFSSKGMPNLILTHSLANTRLEPTPFDHLLRGTVLLESLSLRYSKRTTPLAMAKCYYNGKVYGLLLESMPADYSLYEAAKRLSCYPANTTERHESALTFYQMLQLAGEALGEWQTLIQPRGAGNLSGYQLLFRRELGQYVQTQASNVGALYIPQTVLQQYVEELIALSLKVEHYWVYCYGHADLTHLFYAEEERKIAWVSTEGIDRNINREGEPKGDFGYDFVRFLEWLEFQGFEFLSSTELKEAKESFQKGYEMSAGTLPSLDHQRIYKGYIWLKSLRKCAYHLDRVSSFEEREEPLKMFNYLLKHSPAKIDQR
jgi:hypothetical protein